MSSVHSIESFESNLRSLLKEQKEQLIVVCGCHGSGKSHMVQKILKKDSPCSIYVSLIDKSSKSEIKSEIHTEIKQQQNLLIEPIIVVVAIVVIVACTEFFINKYNFSFLGSLLTRACTFLGLSSITLSALLKLVDSLKPYAEKIYQSRIDNLSFVRQGSVIIFDDFYRTSVQTPDLTKIIKKLKFARKCKVILILNEDKISRESKLEFFNNSDSVLRIETTPEECFDFVFKKNNYKILKQECCKNKITNILFLQKIKKIFDEVKTMLCKFDEQTQKTAIETIVFLQSNKKEDLNDAINIGPQILTEFLCKKESKDQSEELKKAIKLYGKETLQKFCAIHNHLNDSFNQSDYLNLSSIKLNTLLTNIALVNSISAKDKDELTQELTLLQKNIKISDEFSKIYDKIDIKIKYDTTNCLQSLQAFIEKFGIKILKINVINKIIKLLIKVEKEEKANKIMELISKSLDDFNEIYEAISGFATEPNSLFIDKLCQKALAKACSDFNLTQTIEKFLDYTEKGKYSFLNKEIYLTIYLIYTPAKDIVSTIESSLKNSSEFEAFNSLDSVLNFFARLACLTETGSFFCQIDNIFFVKTIYKKCTESGTTFFDSNKKAITKEMLMESNEYQIFLTRPNIEKKIFDTVDQLKSRPLICQQMLSDISERIYYSHRYYYAGQHQSSEEFKKNFKKSFAAPTPIKK